MKFCFYCDEPIKKKCHKHGNGETYTLGKPQMMLSFFEYFLDHACCCNEKWCICKASTFQDMICHPLIKNDKKYAKLVKEINEI